MQLPFLDLVLKAKARFFPLAKSKPATRTIVRVSKPNDQRLSKTVMPSGNRAPVVLDAFGLGSQPPKTRPVTPEPEVGRTLAFQLSDILDQLPGGTVKSEREFDTARAILLKASDVEKGMAEGKPSVPLSSIYQQAPEIFVTGIGPGDVTPILLPYAKVLEQFSNFQVRKDQEHDDDLPQLDTPILQVTMEDTERFGTEIEPLQTSIQPPMKVEPAVAKTLAEAEPEPAVLQLAKPSQSAAETPQARRPKMLLRDLEALTLSPAASPPTPRARPADAVASASKKIPFHLPPNGTGAPAAETVPASGGTPVPTLETSSTSTISTMATEPCEQVALAKPVPAPSPLAVRAPSNDIRPKFTLVPGTEPSAKFGLTVPPAPEPATGESKVVLPLQMILSELPGFQLNASPTNVPDDAKVEFPLSLIEPQLASGKVNIPARVFERSVPEAYRTLFLIDPNETPVTLPLQQVIKQLPKTALRMRTDQEEVTVTEKFETPFSIKAEEDAKRLQKENREDAERSTSNPHHPIDTPLDSSTEILTAPEAGHDSLGNVEAIDAKRAVARASGINGVAGCLISFTDGLTLAGNVPSDLAIDGICSIVPALIDKIDNHLEDTKLGGLIAMTLHCGELSLTFFKQDKLCLTAWHKNGQDLNAEARVQLAQLLQKVSISYREPSHVDH
jgi:hypothetical protein